MYRIIIVPLNGNKPFPYKDEKGKVVKYKDDLTALIAAGNITRVGVLSNTDFTTTIQYGR